MTSQNILESGIREIHKRGSVGDYLKEKIEKDSELWIVSAYFTIYTFKHLKDHLEDIGGMRFLFGEPRFLTSQTIVRNLPSSM